MRRLATLIFLGWLAARVSAAEGTNVRYTVFDAAGNPTQYISAVHVSGGDDVYLLDDPEIQFLAPNDHSKVTEIIWAKTAAYEPSSKRLRSSDEVKMNSPELRVTARGFTLDIPSSVLTLEHDVVARADHGDLFADSAVVALAQEAKPAADADDKLARVKRLDAKGHVRITNKRPGKQMWDEARTDTASYEGDTGLVRSPEVRSFFYGQEVGRTGSFVFPIGGIVPKSSAAQK